MPTGKAFGKPASTLDAAQYDLAQGRYSHQFDKKQPRVLLHNFLSEPDNAKTTAMEMRELASQNKRIKNIEMRFSINFNPVERLSNEQQLKFTIGVLRELGIRDNNHQYFVTSHSDKAHPHHHVFINRVGMDGCTLSDSFLANRLELICDKLEKEMGLDNSLSQKRRFIFDPKSKNHYTTQEKNFKRNRNEITPIRERSLTLLRHKQKIQDEVLRLIREEGINNIDKLKDGLVLKRIDMQVRYDNAGRLTGVAFHHAGLKVKGSSIGLKAAALLKELEKHANNIDKQKDSTLLREKIKLEKRQHYENVPIDVLRIFQENKLRYLNSITEQAKKPRVLDELEIITNLINEKTSISHKNNMDPKIGTSSSFVDTSLEIAEIMLKPSYSASSEQENHNADDIYKIKRRKR